LPRTLIQRKKHYGKIILIGKDFSENKSTEMHHFTKYDKTLLPGMYMNAEIELNSQQSNVLPSEAIVNYENKNYIFIDRDKLFEMKVTTGTSENGYVVLDSNQDLNDLNIVVKGSYSLLMKMKNLEE
jgi:cobalt-zinc-cadmium efflux system membrane fusion protein